MSWAGIATNQTVSADNLANGVATNVLIPKATLYFGAKQLTKQEVSDTIYVSTISKPNNQLVVKSDVSATALYPGYWTWYTSGFVPKRYDPVNGSVSLTAFGANNYGRIACSPSLRNMIVYQWVDIANASIIYSFDGGATLGILYSLVDGSSVGVGLKVAISNDGVALAIFQFHSVLISYGDPNSWSTVLTTSYDEQYFVFCQSGNGQNYYGIKYDSIYNTTLFLANYTYGGGTWYSASPTEINGYEFNDIFCSYDGTYQLYVGFNPVPLSAAGRYVLSTNGGSSFSVGYLGLNQLRACCVSDTGQYMIIINDIGNIWTSNNYGSSFTNLGIPGSVTYGYSCSVNATGTMWMAGTDRFALFATAYDTPLSSWTYQNNGTIYSGEYVVAC